MFTYICVYSCPGIHISLLCVSRLGYLGRIPLEREKELIVRKEREKDRFSHAIVPIAFIHVIISIYASKAYWHSLISPNRDLRRARVYRDLRAR